MVKLNSPLLSLEAHGTLGKAVTFQSGSGRKFAREKPKLPYSLTLAQQYQRWQYEDYCRRWHAQTEAVKAEYRSGGVPFHLTAFQYWMKVMLAELPDLGLWLKFDEKAGAVAHDSSRNLNHAVITGASPADGLIAGALYFDGINDQVVVPHQAAIMPASAISLELFFKAETLSGTPVLMGKSTGLFWDDGYIIWWSGGFLRFFICSYLSYVAKVIFTDTADWHYLCATYDKTLPSNQLNIFLDDHFGTPDTFTGDICPTSADLIFGKHPGGTWFKGWQDNPKVYNRALSETEMLIHAQRRFTL